MVDGLIHGQGQKNKEKRGGKIEREKKEEHLWSEEREQRSQKKQARIGNEFLLPLFSAGLISLRLEKALDKNERLITA